MQQTLALIVFIMTLAGCKSSEVDDRPVVEFSNFDGGTVGCSQPSFGAEQPDISPFTPPEFVTETGEQQVLVRPGEELLGEVTVNGATRKVFVELTNAWAPEQVILTQELDTPGNETIPLSFFTADDVRGRFYMRLTLCGLDCDREVLFDIVEPDPDVPLTGINTGYVRTLIDDGGVVRVDETCVRPNSVLIQ